MLGLRPRASPQVIRRWSSRAAGLLAPVRGGLPAMLGPGGSLRSRGPEGGVARVFGCAQLHLACPTRLRAC
eukprot:9167669-Alexandrium_andersonii.AAC.1